MFGYVRPSLENLTDEERGRYSAVYCGLCRSLGERHGFMGKMSLTYDLTFLVLLLSSLYEPEEKTTQRTCVSHPIKTHAETINSISDYAADMTVALMYHKCLDDWMDDHDLLKRGAAALMEKQYSHVQQLWPAQCAAIEQAMRELNALEQSRSTEPDEAAACFGRLMGELFLWKRDHWQESMRVFGNSLGRFIYLVDAAVDYQDDERKKKYNPLHTLQFDPQNMQHILMATLSGASAVLEDLPLVQDLHILRNILYEGVWLIYNQKLMKQSEGDNHD